MLESFRLEECPRTCYYIPDFITKDEEENLIQNVNSVPKPKWTCLKNRRLQNWGGIPGPKGMVSEQIPEWLKGPCKKIFDLGFFKEKVPNHILINEYLPGQGIMPHSDGPLYFPTVSTITLGSHTFLDFYKPIEEDNHEFDSSLENRYAFSLLLEPRSLVVLQDEMYTVFMHGIKEIDRDLVEEKKIFNFKKLGNLYSESEFLSRKTRISLTIRLVPKVLKINLNSLLFKK